MRSATNAVNAVVTGAREADAEREDARGHPTTAEAPDASTRPTRIRPAATTAPENERTATPAGETIGNGTGTVVPTAGAETMIGRPDGSAIEISSRSDRDGRGSEETATVRVVTVTVRTGGSAEGVPRLPRARGRPRPT